MNMKTCVALLIVRSIDYIVAKAMSATCLKERPTGECRDSFRWYPRTAIVVLCSVRGVTFLIHPQLYCQVVSTHSVRHASNFEN